MPGGGSDHPESRPSRGGGERERPGEGKRVSEFLKRRGRKGNLYKKRKPQKIMKKKKSVGGGVLEEKKNLFGGRNRG